MDCNKGPINYPKDNERRAKDTKDVKGTVDIAFGEFLILAHKSGRNEHSKGDGNVEQRCADWLCQRGWTSTESRAKETAYAERARQQ